MASPLELTLVLLFAACVGVVLFRMLHLPPMLGYLSVGIVIGPHAVGLAADTQRVQYLAEFGVVFLMFSIGIEFSLPKLRTMRRIVLGLGVSQVMGTLLVAVGLGALVNLFWSFSWQASVALGGALAMSSTAIVTKMLAERLELETEHGRNIMGVLLFQDLAVVPLLIVISALGGNPKALVLALSLAALKISGALALLLWIGQKLVGRWFHIVAARRSQELFMLNLLLLTLGLAYVTENLGLSMALGAFIAGMLIAETPFRHQVEDDIKPFRDVLLGLFFITTGMLLDPSIVAQQPLLVLLFFVGPLVVKFTLIAGLARLFGSPPGTAIRTGLGLAQAGEFGFVLLNLVIDRHLLDPSLSQAVLAGMLLSMLCAPFLIINADRIALRFVANEWMMQSLQMTKIATQSIKTSGHVIICGYGRCGQNLARMLEQEGIGYVALDLDPDRVMEAASSGETVVFGDAARREALVAAGIHRAAGIVVTYDSTPAALKVLSQVQALEPTLPVVVRTVDDTHMDELIAAGATEVVPEIVEGSLMLASHALVLLGVPMRRVLRRVAQARNERYSLLRGYFHGLDDEDEGGEREQVRLQSVPLTLHSDAVGRTLGELRLDKLGVTVTAIRRHGIRGVEPVSETRLMAEDIVVLRGLPDKLVAAEARLRGHE
ncbi:cation:proton antiporter [Pandoraea sp. XJJ-1]|uniref:monovalent cation:proton antiporter family protein n=1 Tax=unclassified Pandoraea TaxID=2624094 RepID=UPI00034B4F08|nr:MULTISPECIES: monovalent cation:proton antiporter family protein [unclassified Pandoraea]WAL83390.1 cation:proton antiporter [Pandoraea sp. XJJ-1]BDD91396.1 sodium/hydrogen exchanger family protein [Pandoraea sp. NE5]